MSYPADVSDDWFRNTTWNETIERSFNEKLRRARRKQSYLRIQACYLTRSYPDVPLQLLDTYFSLGEDFDHAQAHVDRAEALLTLGRVNEAIASFEAALAREVEFPNLLTEAYLKLPYLIATRSVREKYDDAIQLLHQHRARLMFSVDHFRWHAASALIAGEIHDPVAAKEHARHALDAATREHSGFRYHPTAGLVTEQYGSLIRKLEEYCAK